MAELIRARDRDTGKVGEFTREFLDAWPNGYFILGPAEGAKTKKQAARSASTAPTGANPEGGA
ncbi:hypothetical protein [Agrococcus sp. DT81.2]|uniref:hypothetical protein n=1 Tax=Agrococcus sp. DT81.2 TaxID=3393414 RepID=UPI003CE4E1C8